MVQCRRRDVEQYIETLSTDLFPVVETLLELFSYVFSHALSYNASHHVLGHTSRTDHD
jgi:hypothetical protein